MVLALWKMRLWQIWSKEEVDILQHIPLVLRCLPFWKGKTRWSEILILFIDWSSTIFQYDVYKDNQSLKNIFKCQLFSWRSRLRSWSQLWRREKDFWSRCRLRRRTFNVEVGRRKKIEVEKSIKLELELAKDKFRKKKFWHSFVGVSNYVW